MKMFSWIFITSFLQTPYLVFTFNLSICYYLITEDFHHEGDLMIGAFFPVHTYYTVNKIPNVQFPNIYYYQDYYLQFNFKNYQYVLALEFAIEEINRNPNLLPNLTLGFDFYNVKFTEKETLMNVCMWLTAHKRGKVLPNYNCEEKNFTAAFTGTSWTTSAHIGTLLQLFRFPQLSIGPYDTALNDHGQYSSLYQMATKDTSLSHGIVSLMLYFRWSWVGLLLPDDHKGNKVLSEFRDEMERERVCIAFVKMIPTTWTLYFNKQWKNMEEIEESSTNVIIIYGDVDSLQGLMRNIGQRLLTGKVWVMNFEQDITDHADYFLLDSFHGSFIFTQHYGESFEFTKFIQTVNPYKYPEDIYLPKMWHYFFKCSYSEVDCKLLDNCQANATLNVLPRHIFDVSMSKESYNIYNAVYAVAHSLHEITLKQVQMQPCKNGEELLFYPWQINSFLRKNMGLDWRQKRNEEYDILNLWNFPKGLGLKIKIGKYSENAPDGQQLTLSDQMIQWPEKFSEIPQSVCSESCGPGFRKVTLEGQAVCCYNCTPCAENEISNETDVDHCVKCPESYYANTEKNHCLQKAQSFLAYEDPLGMALTSISLLFSALTVIVVGIFVRHRHTPMVKANNRALSYTLLISLNFCFLCSLNFIGQPNTATCILQQTIFGVAFTVALATVLAKAITVVIAFKATFPGRIIRWLMISRAPNYTIPICTLIQLVLCGIWMATFPPFVDQDDHTEHGHVIIFCNKGSSVAFHCALGYLCFLALGSYAMAFFSRNLPDTFNESKFLSFSMLVFFCVWITFLPVYHSTKGKIMLAMEVFCILASSAALLGFIFTPKCYIILLRPEKNSFHRIRNKIHSKGNVSQTIVQKPI
ncbi:vomeronasal 2 receptor 11 [Rattus norvegicus]|uniref:Vomeronasal 2 receptor, 11 n=1 Tax=Rattus norvegicus TaxID=10116 RepID=A0A8I6ABS9_RAT|nr:vomeronasal 2 receptor 11 [Rattus norvegicus]|eukprot:NP_001092940.1 vomeronasal 2 receptor 11 [Rattus norvegicus]